VLRVDDPLCGAAEGFEARRWDTGEVISRTEVASKGKLMFIHRGDLQLALTARIEGLDNVEIRLDSRVIDIDPQSPEIVLWTGDRISGDLIIVADGVNSRLKDKIRPSESEIVQPMGDAAYRLCFERQLFDNDADLLDLVQVMWIKRWDGPSGHVIAYPIHNREMLNVVLMHPDDGLAEESWKSMTEKKYVINAYEGWDPIIQVSRLLNSTSLLLSNLERVY
jgi:salicylate hydroxylase